MRSLTRNFRTEIIQTIIKIALDNNDEEVPVFYSIVYLGNDNKIDVFNSINNSIVTISDSIEIQDFFGSKKVHLDDKNKIKNILDLFNLDIVCDEIVVYPINREDENAIGLILLYKNKDLNFNKEATSCFENLGLIVSTLLNVQERYIGFSKIYDLIEEAISISNLGIYLYDIVSRDIYRSDLCTKILGFEKDKSVDKFFEKIDSNYRMKYLQALRNCKTEKSSFNIIYKFDVHGEERWMKESSKVVLYDNNTYLIGTISDVTEEIEDNYILRKLAYFDNLTGLYNRNKFRTDIKELMNNDIPITLFMIDIDNFKYINDTFGHSVGDDLLVCIANILRAFEKYDKIHFYRLTGDEFLIIFEGTNDKEDIEMLIDELLALFDKKIEIANAYIKVDPSIGVACFPEHADNLDDLVRFADYSMYRSKSNPLVNYTFFSKEIYDEALEVINIESKIREVIDKNEIDALYQPIYDYNKNKIIGFEALLNVDIGYSNERIMDIVSKSNFIIELEKSIISKILEQIAEIKDILISENLFISINLSPYTLKHIDIDTLFYSFIKKYNINASLIAFEISERNELHDFDRVCEIISKMKDIGFKVILDDFGVGASSIMYLDVEGIDFYKIDKTLINTTLENPKFEQVLKHLKLISDELGKKIIFEGIENEKLLELLHSNNVQYAQGYYLGVPEAISKYIVTSK